MTKSKKIYKGGLSARPGTLNVKCPNMDCGTAGLPGFHAVWKKGGFLTKTLESISTTKKSRTNSKTKLRNKTKSRTNTKSRTKSK